MAGLVIMKIENIKMTFITARIALAKMNLIRRSNHAQSSLFGLKNSRFALKTNQPVLKNNQPVLKNNQPVLKNNQPVLQSNRSLKKINGLFSKTINKCTFFAKFCIVNAW